DSRFESVIVYEVPDDAVVSAQPVHLILEATASLLDQMIDIHRQLLLHVGSHLLHLPLHLLHLTNDAEPGLGYLFKSFEAGRLVCSGGNCRRGWLWGQLWCSVLTCRDDTAACGCHHGSKPIGTVRV